MFTKKLSPKGAEALRVARVRQLFQIRHPGKLAGKPKGTEVLKFFGWLQHYNPYLLPQGKQGDPYQHLKVDLVGLCED
jgi:hypothetical protein